MPVNKMSIEASVKSKKGTRILPLMPFISDEILTGFTF